MMADVLTVVSFGVMVILIIYSVVDTMDSVMTIIRNIKEKKS